MDDKDTECDLFPHCAVKHHVKWTLVVYGSQASLQHSVLISLLKSIHSNNSVFVVVLIHVSKVIRSQIINKVLKIL